MNSVRRTFIRLVFFFVAWAIPLPGLADSPAPVEFTINRPGFVLKGVRYPNLGAPPLVLQHGLMCNSRGWKDFGWALHEVGFDIWMPNFRGHGNGSLRSFVKNAKRGDYRFTKLVTEDEEAIAEMVWAETRLKMGFVGHSNGANTAKAWLAGVRANARTGRPFVDSAYAEWLAKERVFAFVGLGGPPHFRRLTPGTKILGMGYDFVSSLVDLGIPSPARNRNPLLPDDSGVAAWMRARYRGVVEKVGPHVVPEGVFKVDNLDPSIQEFSLMAEKGTSQLPADLGRSYARFVSSGKYIEDGLDYERAKRIFVPTLLVGGDKDSLSSAPEIEKEARQMSRENGHPVEFFLAPNTGHGDLMIGKRAARIVGKRTAGFLSLHSGSCKVRTVLEAEKAKLEK